MLVGVVFAEGLLILVGSRERPGMVARLLACCHGLPLTVVIDETEPRTGEYRALGVDLIIRPGESCGVAAKIAHGVRERLAEVYVILSDRCIPRTPGWYDRLQVRGVGLTRTTFDGVPRGFSATFSVHRRCFDATGWVSPPGIDHYGFDNFWCHASRAAGIATETGVHIDIPDYAETDEVRARTRARAREYERQWLTFRESRGYDEAVERLRCIS